MNNTTWHDQKPSHKPISKAVIVANEHAIIARTVFDKYVEDCLNDPDRPLNWSEIDYLGKRANDAEDRAEKARHEALNPCTCTPLSDACPVCKADIDRKYGDSIPFGGE